MLGNDVDKKLNAKLKMFEEIDKLVFDPADENKQVKDDILCNIYNNGQNALHYMKGRVNSDAIGKRQYNQNSSVKGTLTMGENKNLSRNMKNNFIPQHGTCFKLNKSSLNHLKSTDNTISKNSFDAYKTEINSNRMENRKLSELNPYINNYSNQSKIRSRNVSRDNSGNTKQTFRSKEEVFARLYPFRNQANLSKDRSGLLNKHQVTQTVMEEFKFHPKISNKTVLLEERYFNSKDGLVNSKYKSKIKKEENFNSNEFTRSFSKGFENPYSQVKSTNYFQQAEWINKSPVNGHYKRKGDEISLTTLAYRPSTNRSKSRDSSIIKNKVDPEIFFHKQKIWKQALINRNEKKRENKLNQEFSQCTFKPNIEPLGIQDDELVIKRNISQLMNYVNKRQIAISQRKEKEMSKTPEDNYNYSINSPIKKDSQTARNKDKKKEIKLTKAKESFKSEKYFENTQFSMSYLKKMKKNM